MSWRRDFSARIHRLREQPFRVGHWPQFHYPGERNGYVLYPCDWFHLDGTPILEGEAPEDCIVNLSIVAAEFLALHRLRITVGTEFEWKEGTDIIATGVVTRILELGVD
jgi:hypothetical protein